MKNKNILITGANRGIGLELASQLSEQGANIFAVCRNSSPRLNDLGVNVIEGIDLLDLNNIIKLKSILLDIKIDILINNAGIFNSDNLGSLDSTSLIKQFEVNSLAPLMVVDSLLDNLQSGSKVILITSIMGSCSENQVGGYYGYRMSKAALNIAGKSLASDLKHRNISVGIVHPGYVKTEMTSFMGDIEVHTSANLIIKIIKKIDLNSSGKFYHSNGKKIEW